MTKKTNNANDICEIFYYNKDDFDVGKIVYRKKNFIVYIDFNIFGEYNGLILQEHRAIEELCYKDKYIQFMKKIIDIDSIKDLNLITKEDFISYAINNNRILAIITKNQDIEEFKDIKIVDFDGEYLKYQIYERYGELRKRIHKEKLSNIVMMQIDSKYTRLLEKIRVE